MIFAPSVPVVCDPTGQFEVFIKKNFLQNMSGANISAADLFANEKLAISLKNARSAIVNDLNLMRKMSNGLSQDHSLMKRLSSTIYNGYDFNEHRTAKLRRIGTLDSFFNHFDSVNKRIQSFEGSLDNISLYQVQIFQQKFDFQLNTDFL